MEAVAISRFSSTPPSPTLLANMNKANKAKCRACLSMNRDTVKLDTNVPDLQSARSYGESFRHCTGLELNVCSAGGYKWPMQMCVRCCRALEVAMHFVELALESDRVLHSEAQSVKPAVKQEPELKRKASHELLRWNQFGQEFEQFVESYDEASAPIEENVLYMRGAKMPRLDADTTVQNKSSKEDEVILFDVKYDTNNIDEDDDNDGSDAKNNETFFENSKTPVDIDRSENNNNYNFNNKNGDLSGLPDVECDLIQRALFMTLNDDASGEQSPEECEIIESIKAKLLQSSEILTTANTCLIEPETAPDKRLVKQRHNSPSGNTNDNLNIPVLGCNMCNFTQTEAKQMRSHYKREHSLEVSEDEITGLANNLTFKCRCCNNYTTKDKGEMQTHLIENHRIEKDFENNWYEQQNCPACARVFKDQRSARTHYTRVHTAPSSSPSHLFTVRDSKEQHICNACGKVFNQRASLQNHQRFCQVAQPVHCTFCEKQFSSIRKYELHLQQQHAVDTVHECEICHKNFKNADSLALHRKRHMERHFQCVKCSLNYVNATELKVHYERAHVQEEQQVSCSSCGIKFQNFALLREHEQRSHQQKTWRCETCSFEASSRARLRQHQYEHTGYPYKCMQCEEEFIDRSKIRQHSKKAHGVELTDDQLADMFRERIGYTNRHDAFSKSNNLLEVPGFSDDCYSELKSLGVDYDDITHDLFSNSSNALDNLLDLIP
ncbi:zinc finger imprinted 3 [Scaptodrosophila lebanonensis]|uniref:Zinc finger imprinted 3 n=1 Tax=Drosophila lebanonensis TaxID=7225 RepID=A0A6J2TKV6_DROLE|nr:zinc finger imprinted 3 [Scaptodrosophila lebanonensis]